MAETFGSESTTDEVLAGVDLTGKRILVTGASAGLGVETARALAARGASIVGAARDLAKARAATAHIPGVDLVELDLASLASARNCADELNAHGEPFDIVIANAGVMACPKGVTADGFETQFGTNHLGHFAFINRIAPLVRDRVVALSSAAHQFADVDLEDPNFERTAYTPFVAYGRSKTANALFAVEFDRRHRARGVRAASVHPGGIQTELGRHLTQEVLAELMDLRRRAGRPMDGGFKFKSIPQGAATSVWVAVVADGETIGGRYCEDCHVAALVEVSTNDAGGVRPYAQDPDHAKALWALSETMVGERF